MKKLCAVAVLVFLADAALAAPPPTPRSSPVAAADSLQLFQLPDDLAIELAAAEPEVVDPIDVRFDEQGRMYVVEMRDYPLGPKHDQKPLSKIKLLEDRDGDGRYETAHVFAEDLLFPTGLQPWKGGVIVTLAGRVIFLKDTDGDHKADLEETWFTGFVEENSQLRANHPRLAHDNHIYIANGLRGGKIVDTRGEPEASAPAVPGADAKGSPIDISGRDFRFDPRGTLAEPVSGVGQYGLCFDDFGHRFVCQNRNPVQHVVFEERDLKKSKHYTPPAVMNDVAAFAETSKLFPLTKTWTTSNLHENTFTAACGVNIYRGHALPEAYRGLALTCDPTGNLVHAEKMEPWGPTFRSKPLYEDREFLASTDEWFRPVAIENGPDGALYIVDMYRAVIEHPDWVPDELKRRPDERFGDERGRIYRIVMKGQRTGKFDVPARASPQQLVQMLAHENAWQRETAQRLLIERGENDVAGDLAELLEHERPEAVFHALWTLQGLGGLKVKHLEIAAQRKESSIIRTVARIYGSTNQTNAQLRTLILKGPTVHDRFGLAGLFAPLAPLTASESSRRATEATAFEEDPWSRYEVLMTAPIPVSSTLGGAFGLVDERSEGTPGWASIEHMEAMARELGQLAGFLDDTASLNDMLSDMDEWWVRDGNIEFVRNGILGLSEGLARRGKRLSDVASTDSAKRLVARATESAIARAANTNRVEEYLLRRDRLPAIDFLRHQDSAECKHTLAGLTRDPTQAVRIAAIKAVLGQGTEEIAAGLLARARSESPAVKRVILEGLVARPITLVLLLDAIEKQELQTTDIDPALVPRIVNVADPALKARAQKLFAPPPSADLQKTLAEYSAALKPNVDAKAGRLHFEKHCATCHKVGDVGVDVAPDISDSRTKTAAQVLLDVLQPNRAVDGNYVAYVVTKVDGQVLTGVISAETSQAITLKQPGGMSVVVPRSEIDELQSAGKSLMPEGLERNIPPQEMALIVAYVKNWRYLDGRIPADGVQK